jgi:hypothetical protein
VDTAASVRELREERKASHRGHRGKSGVGVENCLVNTASSGWERSPEPSQHLTLSTGLSWGSYAKRGKHRTEATEVTEGEIGWGVENCLVNMMFSGWERTPELPQHLTLSTGLSCGSYAKRESIAQRPQRSHRGKLDGR